MLHFLLVTCHRPAIVRCCQWPWSGVPSGARILQLSLWFAFGGLGEDLFTRKSPLSAGTSCAVTFCARSKGMQRVGRCATAPDFHRTHIQLAKDSKLVLVQASEPFWSSSAFCTWLLGVDVSVVSCQMGLRCVRLCQCGFRWLCNLQGPELWRHSFDPGLCTAVPPHHWRHHSTRMPSENIWKPNGSHPWPVQAWPEASGTIMKIPRPYAASAGSNMPHTPIYWQLWCCGWAWKSQRGTVLAAGLWAHAFRDRKNPVGQHLDQCCGSRQWELPSINSLCAADASGSYSDWARIPVACASFGYGDLLLGSRWVTALVIFSTSGHFHSITSVPEISFEVWSHLFQSAHRWTHFPPDELSHGLQTDWTAVLDTFIWTHAVIYLLSHPKLRHMSPQALVGHRLAKDAGAFPWTPQPHATSVLGLAFDETKVLNPLVWDLRPHGTPPGFGEAIHDSATWWKTSTLRTLASQCGNSLQWLQCSRAPQVWTHRFDPRSFGQAAASCALWLLVCVAGPSEATSCVRFSHVFSFFSDV